MIEPIKKLYALIPHEELDKDIFKIDNISESGLDNSTKIIYKSRKKPYSYT